MSKDESMKVLEDYGCSRRSFLKGLGALGVATITSETFFSQRANAQNNTKQGGNLNINMGSDIPHTLRPSNLEIATDLYIGTNIWNGLFQFNEKLGIEGDLAEKWEFVDDRSLKIKIKEDVLFHNGDPLTSEDVKFSIQSFQEETSPVKGKVAVINEVEIHDKYTFTIHLKKPFAPILSYLTRDAQAGLVFPKGVYEGVDIGEWVDPVGSGPFKFKDYIEGEELILERFDGYFKPDRPYLDQCTYTFLVEPETALGGLKTKKIDFLDRVPLYAAQELRTTSGIKALSTPAGNISQLSMNHGKKIFKDKNLRRAISMAIDREGLVQSVLYGEGVAARSVISPLFNWAYNPAKEVEIPYVYYRPEEAKKLIKKYGYEGTEIDVMGWTSPIFSEGAKIIGTMLSNVGLKPKVRIVSISKLVDDLLAGNYMTVFARIMGRVDPDGAEYGLLHTNGGFNHQNISDSTRDDLIEKARSTSIQTDRAAYYSILQKYDALTCPNAFVFHNNLVRGIRDYVKGYVLKPTNDLNLENVWVEK